MGVRAGSGQPNQRPMKIDKNQEQTTNDQSTASTWVVGEGQVANEADSLVGKLNCRGERVHPTAQRRT